MKCRCEYHNKNKTEFELYKQRAKFKFNLKDYPNKFDFTLIKKYGWYKAKNRGDNLNGVSRDHMLSIKGGFRQGIEPELLAHPANCKLMRNNDNIRKNDKCTITYEELLERIKNW
jgi:hypothetical protein